MKELDFDELDKAVNSLMANVPKTSPQSDDAKVKTLSIDSTLDDAAPVSFDKVEETAAKVVDEAANSPAPVAEPTGASKAAEPAAHAAAVHARPQPSVTTPARKGGRFMDVVHPSADMKKPDVPRPVSRQGATIEPLSSSAQKISDIVPQKKTKTPDEKPEEAPKQEEKPAVKEDIPEPAPVAAPAVPASVEEPPKADEAPAPISDWPDPLDMMAAEPEKKDTEKETKAEAETPENEEPKAEEVPAPLTSPFLPDTKVEKRPLGGVPAEADTPVEEPSRPPVASEEETPKTIDDPNAQLPADPNEVETQLPEELRGDLMAVEADTTHDELKQAHESKLGAIAPSKPVVETEPTKPSASEEPVAAGPTSIPQQYREEPSTGDKDNGAIYDTDTYHQPLSHPAKKKSGWLWVAGIVAVLLLGAGGGAALFLLGLV